MPRFNEDRQRNRSTVASLVGANLDDYDLAWAAEQITEGLANINAGRTDSGRRTIAFALSVVNRYAAKEKKSFFRKRARFTESDSYDVGE